MQESKDVRWRKSSRSGQETNCVEIGRGGPTLAVRDSKAPHGGALTVGVADLIRWVK